MAIGDDAYIDGSSSVSYGGYENYVYAWTDASGNLTFQETDFTWTLAGNAVREAYMTLDGQTGGSSVSSQTWSPKIGNYNETSSRISATLRGNGRYGGKTKTVYAEPWKISDCTLIMTLPAEIYSVGETLYGSVKVDNPSPYSTGYEWSVNGSNVICNITSSSDSGCTFSITGNYPSLSTNTTITIYANYGTKSISKTMTMKPSLTGVQILSTTSILNVDNNFTGVVNVRPLPIGTGAPITYSATSSNTALMTIGSVTAVGNGTYNIQILGQQDYYGTGLRATVKAALTPNPSLNFSSATGDIYVRPNMRVYNSGFRRGQPYVYNGSSWREAVEVYTYNGSSWRRENIR